MIPKVIHYVWLGKREKPEKIKNAMVTWQKVLGQDGYKIIEWNEKIGIFLKVDLRVRIIKPESMLMFRM